jgi:hypothetical protein
VRTRRARPSGAGPGRDVETLEIREDDDGDFPWIVREALTMRGTRTEAPLAVRNRDEFYLYLDLRAERPGSW